MSGLISERVVREVLAWYPVLFPHDDPRPLGNRGGFSGCQLWRLVTAQGPVCLRAWPPDTQPERIDFSHRLMRHACAASLSFVPRLFSTPDGRTWHEHACRYWEAAAWLPGVADYHRRPSPARLVAAATGLARLHECWCSLARRHDVCTGVRRRLALAQEWRERIAGGWHPLNAAVSDDPVRPVAERASLLLPRWLPLAFDALAPLANVAFPPQPCLVDPWHDNLLFEGDRLTGLVDYGSARIDHPAVDVARLLGSLAGDDPEAWRIGLSAYRTIRCFTKEEEDLARLLDRTGTVLGTANWLLRLYCHRQAYENLQVVAQRLDVLVARMEGWESGERP
jgi:homoserine kinase type II